MAIHSSLSGLVGFSATVPLAIAVGMIYVVPAPAKKPMRIGQESEACQQGKSVAASGDVLKAIRMLALCVEREPGNWDATVALGGAYLEAGQFSGSVEAYAKARALKPLDDAQLEHFLSALEGSGNIAEQIPVLATLNAHRPKDIHIAERLLTAVETVGIPGRLDEYMSALETLSDKPAANPVHSAKLAQAYLRAGKSAPAEKIFRDLLKRSPESGEYWAGLASSQSQAHPAQAAESYGKAALYSDQAEQRKTYQAQALALSKPGSPLTSPSASPSLPASSTPVVVKKNSAAAMDSVKPQAAKIDAARIAAEEKSKAQAEAQRIAREAQRVLEEKAEQEKLAAERKSKEELQAQKEKEKEKEKQERQARAEKEKQDNAAREEKARQAKAAAEEKAKQDLLARENADKQRIAEEKARKLKEDAEKQEKVARDRKERYGHALGLYQTGHLDSAAIVFKAVLEDSPVVQAYYSAGCLMLARSDFGKALTYLNQGPQDIPDLAGLKGKACVGLGKYMEGLPLLESQYAKTKNDSFLEPIIEAKQKTGDEPGAMGFLQILSDRRPEQENLHLRLAQFYRNRGDTLRASEQFSRVLICNPNQLEANIYLGMEAAHRGDFSRAAPLLEKATAALPQRGDLWKLLGGSEWRLGRKEKAWDAYAKAFTLAPTDRDIARARLEIAVSAGRADLAKALEDEVRLSPEDQEARLGLARLRFGQENYPAAEKEFKLALPHCGDAGDWAEMGRALMENKKVDEAAAAFQKAISLGNSDPHLKYELARVRMEKGDLDGAENLVKELGKNSTSDPEPLYWLGLIALKRQQTPVAEEYFLKANHRQPNSGKYAEAFASLKKDKDEFTAAISALKAAESNLSPSGQLLYADCLANSGDGATALALYSQLSRQNPSSRLLARRMDLLVRLGRGQEAVDLAAGSGDLQKDNEVMFSGAKAQLALSEAHILKGDVDLAIDVMKKVIDADSHKPEYHYYLGLGYYDQGQWKKARNEFSDALTYRVEYPEAQFRKGFCQIKLEDGKDAENTFGDLSMHAEPLWKARGYYGLALAFESEGKFEAIAHHLQLSIAADPLPEAMAYMSRIMGKAGKVSEAEEWARKALTIDPACEEATVALSEALVAGKRREEAMALARKGLREKPLSCDLMVQSAKISYQEGRMDSTFASGSNAIRICPEEPMGYFYAGVATHSIKGAKDAKPFFKSYQKLGGNKKLLPEN